MRVLVDSHVHLRPSPLSQRVRDLFDATLPGQVVYPIEVRALLQELQAEGVSAVWALPYAHRSDVAGWMNEATAGLRDELAGGAVTIVAGATVHPGDQDPAGIVSHAVTELGARVLKLHCAVTPT